MITEQIPGAFKEKKKAPSKKQQQRKLLRKRRINKKTYQFYDRFLVCENKRKIFILFLTN